MTDLPSPSVEDPRPECPTCGERMGLHPSSGTDQPEETWKWFCGQGGHFVGWTKAQLAGMRPSPSVEGGEPTTEAGRAWLADPKMYGYRGQIRRHILAIEREARAGAASPLDPDALRHALQAWQSLPDDGGEPNWDSIVEFVADLYLARLGHLGESRGD